MADLTEEEKIVIGVCSAVAGLVLLGIIIFVCCILYRRRRYPDRHYRERKDRYYSRERIDDGWRNHDRFYGNGEIREKKYPPPFEPLPLPEPLPPPLPLPPPPPPAPRSRWDLYGGHREFRREREPVYIREQEPIYVSTDKTYGMDVRRDMVTDFPPIVIPMSEPEYIVSDPIEPNTIYLKYRDDQALLYASPAYERRVERRAIRRARSLTEIDRPRSKFVGEWGHPIFQPHEMAYNERAARRGKDPFLWKY